MGEEGKGERRNELILGGAGTRDEDLRQNRTRFIKPGLGIPAPRTNNARQTTNADQPTRTAVALKPVISSRAHTKVPRKGRKVDRYSAATQRNTQAEKQKCLMHSANRTCRGAGKG